MVNVWFILHQYNSQICHMHFYFFTHSISIAYNNLDIKVWLWRNLLIRQMVKTTFHWILPISWAAFSFLILSNPPLGRFSTPPLTSTCTSSSGQDRVDLLCNSFLAKMSLPFFGLHFSHCKLSFILCSNILNFHSNNMMINPSVILAREFNRLSKHTSDVLLLF